MRHKNLYQQIKSEHQPSKKEKIPKEHWLRGPLLWFLIPAAALAVFVVLRRSQSLMDLLVFQITTPVKHLLSRVFGMLPFAMAEVIWAVGVLSLLIFLVRTVYLLIRREDRFKRLIRRTLALLSAGCIVYGCYSVMWGANYYAESFVSRSGLTQRESTVEELASLTASFAEECNRLAAEMPREDGVTALDNGQLFCNANELYSGIQQEFPLLKEPLFDPKPMVFSGILSKMGFTGFYFPMTAESLVNVDQPDCLIPATILHELAHQCNVAEEDAANFVAILAGLRSGDPVFRYSSAMLGYIHLSNALYRADKTVWQSVAAIPNEMVRADLNQNNEFWNQNESPVQTVSETIYEGYLKSVGHKEGMKSYGMCVDLLAGYYFSEKK